MTEFESLASELKTQRGEIKTRIDALNLERDGYALNAVMGDTKAKESIAKLDEQIIPLGQEVKTIDAALAELERKAEKAKRDAELQAKRDLFSEFDQCGSSIIEQAGKVAEKMSELKPLIDELERLVNTTHKYTHVAGTPSKNLEVNDTLRRAILHGTGLAVFDKTSGVRSNRFEQFTNPYAFLNAIVAYNVNRTARALAQMAELDAPEEKLLDVPSAPEKQQHQRKAIPKTKIKVVRVKGGLDVVRVTDGDVIAELNDEPNAFNEWFNEPGKQWNQTFELEGEAYPVDSSTDDKSVDDDSVKITHKGKGYWQIQDANGQDLLDEAVQGKDNAVMLAQQLGLSVK
ncbi:hypothetical protein R7P74_23555 [Vibrio sp. 2033]|uniref:hypothetical protein n=1 Tax=Vibrio sp. 2033 TaxID=3074589 RepID=UPI002964EC13|nr:hypothetical protein [Vibrio sp. 2033]MDW2126610.1 hypothetical protein [Vibrio sp. 2033]